MGLCMQGIGGLLVFLGAGSFVLHYLNMEFFLLGWVDRWGPGAGAGIRVALIAIGAVLWFLGKPKTETR